MQILDGKVARAYYTGELLNKIKKLSFLPCLVIIQIGSRVDSDTYIKAKKKFASKIGVKEIHLKFDENVNKEEIISVIKKYNHDDSVNGIIVQLPLPSHLDSDSIIKKINPQKDIDGLTPSTIFMPATARGVSQLFDFYKIDLTNKKVTVLGRSKLVGMPIAKMCKDRGAFVTVCHSKTINTEEETKKADIVIVAIGKPYLIDEKYISKDQIVIDVGITKEKDIIKGDVNFKRVEKKVSMITPVPGGVGQMTVLALFENLIDACYNANY